MSKLKTKEELEDFGDLPQTKDRWDVCCPHGGGSTWTLNAETAGSFWSDGVPSSRGSSTPVRLHPGRGNAETSSVFAFPGASAAGLKVASARLPSPKTLVGSPAQILAQFPKQQSPKHLQQGAPLGAAGVGQTHTSSSTSPASKPTIQIKQESGTSDQLILLPVWFGLFLCVVLLQESRSSRSRSSPAKSCPNLRPWLCPAAVHPPSWSSVATAPS